MKTIKFLVAFCLFAMVTSFQINAQNDNDQMFAVYTYEIMPEKVKAEEAFVKEMKVGIVFSPILLKRVDRRKLEQKNDGKIGRKLGTMG